jgi:hypothetical protein
MMECSKWRIFSIFGIFGERESKFVLTGSEEIYILILALPGPVAGRV